jgi:hypothetical protein
MTRRAEVKTVMRPPAADLRLYRTARSSYQWAKHERKDQCLGVPGSRWPAGRFASPALFPGIGVLGSRVNGT